MNLQLLRKAIEHAGGTKAVGRACDCSYQAVQKWMVNGLPRTEFSGETTYARTICELAAVKEHEYDPKALLEETRNGRQRSAA